MFPPAFDARGSDEHKLIKRLVDHAGLAFAVETFFR
jgi:hypothetical protein